MHIEPDLPYFLREHWVDSVDDLPEPGIRVQVVTTDGRCTVAQLLPSGEWEERLFSAESGRAGDGRPQAPLAGVRVWRSPQFMLYDFSWEDEPSLLSSAPLPGIGYRNSSDSISYRPGESVRVATSFGGQYAKETAKRIIAESTHLVV